MANFVSKFVTMATELVVREKCDWRRSMAHPENPFIGAKISYANRVIANFVPNFVAMATEVNRG